MFPPHGPEAEFDPHQTPGAAPHMGMKTLLPLPEGMLPARPPRRIDIKI